MLYSELSRLVSGGRLLRGAAVKRRPVASSSSSSSAASIGTRRIATPAQKSSSSSSLRSGTTSRTSIGGGSYPYPCLYRDGPPAMARTRGFHGAPCCPSQLPSGTGMAPQGLSPLISLLDDDDDDYDEDAFSSAAHGGVEQHRWWSPSTTATTTSLRDDAPGSTSSSSLDLELGEGSVWDGGGRMDSFWEDENDYDPHNWQQRRRPPREDRVQKSAVELLMHFDPVNPPVSDDPDDLQLWLECEAQQEAVLKYQWVLESARERKDYSSLSLVQQQVVRWFPKLHEEIANRQRQYMFKQHKSPAKNNTIINDIDNANADADSTADGTLTQQQKKLLQNPGKAASRYGPYLCTLPPAKLAIIAAHEAIMHALLKSGLHGKDGVPFVSMAKRIGEAVEEEVLIHRVLHRRFKEAQEFRSRPEELSETDKRIAELVGATAIPVTDTAVTGTASTNDDSSVSPMNDDLKPAATHKWTYTTTHLQNYLDESSKYKPSAKKRRVVAYALRRARQVLENEKQWTTAEKIQLGAALFQVLLEHATVYHDGKEEMAFTYEKRWLRKNKLKAFVQLNDRLYGMVVSDKLESLSATTTRHKPMIRPPLPWKEVDKGGYLWIKADLMRYHGCNTQEEALRNADLTTVFDGLNALGRVPWKINQRILEVAQKCWEGNIPLGDIPSQTDYEVPPEPVQPDGPPAGLDKESSEYIQIIAENKKYREAFRKYNRIRQRNMDLRSLRAAAMLKLDQGEKFKEFDKIYFPYNMDFRGRAYPVPPHLSNVGSDLCRGMLKFSEAKPLGPRGLYWLKVHLANLAGMDKVSFDDRASFVDENIEKVRQSVADPFAGDRWWMKLDDPFQGLATCVEIVSAIDSGEPESYPCSLAVHMDGSCNGLQHYAALGRDVVGGKAVNLCAMEDPQDVYIGVMHEVIRRVAEEAERMLDFDDSDFDSLDKKQRKALINNRAAKLVNGLIDRGVVKRTVMTSVYGVTYVGARHQISEKIESKLEDQGVDIDEKSSEIFQACGYLARQTMDVMGDLFTGAKKTMNWLTTCAALITQHGYPVAWISPIGLPVIQPYRQKKAATITTLLQTVTVTDESDDLPIHTKRQVTAFPPNYVHSLDSSHMLLTALEMDRRGLTFSAVHDSFWTHACDIDEMNVALRDVFVDLYDQPLLESLKQTWEMRYPGLEFPDLPERGGLDLNDVKKAKYFFQ